VWRSFKDAVNAGLGHLGYRIAATRDPMAIQASLLRGRTVSSILDVGANVGQMIAPYRRRFPEATIHAFEPHPGCFDRLRARFGEDPRLRLVQMAMGEAEGTSHFLVSDRPTRHSLLAPVRGGIQEEIEVQVTTLDAYLARTGIPHVDLLKVDVEGGELAVLRGARAALSDRRISGIFMEAMFIPHYEGQALFHELASHLAGFGFRVVDITDLRYTAEGQLRWGNVIFSSA
jgi:FkbM family methyltransferase